MLYLFNLEQNHSGWEELEEWNNKIPRNNPGWHPAVEPEVAVASQRKTLSMKHQHHYWISNFHHNQGICMPEPVKIYKSQQQIYDLLSGKILGGNEVEESRHEGKNKKILKIF